MKRFVREHFEAAVVGLVGSGLTMLALWLLAGRGGGV